ncbi:Sec-independent protein translocase protein TatB [Ahrensia sp. R2A130]|uniref:Sec-independent protein translocase protein TatB n=1 Tax=Ahrensia sp. R2A130 TaxID=744979 RepID=UPI0001E0E858|nr:Sec-independent protein translocase protein TatB [Ahrensia sp. R2A130]EFL90382.1 putative Sec-independent protein translocase protein TatB-like protein [Ahrensia sp. R2A130]
MFDIGATEMLVVAIIAILFVGPKELPGMLRTFGRTTKKLRGMAGDLRQQFDEAIEDAELDSVRDTINDARKLDPTKAIKDKLNPLKGELEDAKSMIEEAADFDPKSFSANYGDDVGEPAAKPNPSVGKNAVPGFAEVPPPEAAKPKTKRKPTAKSATAKPAKVTATKKPAARKTTASKKTDSAKPAAAKKPAATTKRPAAKSAAKKTAAKA